MKTKLTHNEHELLESVAKGMDSPGCGWLGELATASPKRTTGILGSLVKKGLVESIVDSEPGRLGVDYWIVITEAGMQALEEIKHVMTADIDELMEEDNESAE